MGQHVAAVAGGALLGIAAMLTLKLRAVERRAERQRRIDDAVRSILDGVETFRQERLDSPPELGSAAIQEPDSAVEVRAKAHLRLMMDRPQRKGSGRGGERSPRRARSASKRWA